MAVATQQVRLAELAGLSIEVVKEITEGDRKIDTEVAEGLSKAFGTSAEIGYSWKRVIRGPKPN